MLIVCKGKEEATIYMCESIFDAGNAVEIGAIWNSTPMWAVLDGEDSETRWSCRYDTKDGFCHEDTMDECIESFVNKVREDVKVWDGTIEEFAEDVEAGAC